jgi:hypothetical protein
MRGKETIELVDRPTEMNGSGPLEMHAARS